MEVVFIVIQHPLNALYPVVKGEFQFKPLNFTQKFLNASEKILWPGALLSCQCRSYVPEKSEIRRFQVRTVRRMGYSKNRIIAFLAKISQRHLSGGRDNCQGANLADENAVCGRPEILRAGVVPKYD
jgi:hypothetical protein